MNSQYNTKYDSKRRFASYWHQIREVLNCTPEHVLEVGVGSGFVSRYLRDLGIKLVTIDNDPKLKPDTVADIISLPFPDSSFDVVTAYEVLEHMPYNKSLMAYKELRRVSSNKVIISLPDATRIACIEFPIPYIKKIKKQIILPRLFPKVHKITKSGHYWEIGKKNYKFSRIVEDIKKEDLVIEKTYRVFENPHHRFFVLKKII